MTSETCYVIVDLSNEDEVEVCSRSFTTKKSAKEHVLTLRPDDGVDEWGGDDPMLRWEGDDVLNEEGRVLYMVRKVKLSSV